MTRRPCTIAQVGKRRNGQPRYWCTEHGGNSTGRYGAKLLECESAHLYVDIDECFDLDESTFSGGIGVWGAVSSIYNTSPWEDPGGVHVHARDCANDDKKAIDRTFPALAIKYRRDLLGDRTALITQEAAISYYISRFLNHEISHLFCVHCGEVHLDAGYFAVNRHRKHLLYAAVTN